MYQELSYLIIGFAYYNLMLYWYKSQKQKMQVLTWPSYVLYFLAALYFSSNILYFVHCLVFNSLLQSICFRMICSKHSITFDAYLLSCWFHCVDIFYIKFRSCETFTVTNFGPILLMIETLSSFKTIKC